MVHGDERDAAMISLGTVQVFEGVPAESFEGTATELPYRQTWPEKHEGLSLKTFNGKRFWQFFANSGGGGVEGAFVNWPTEGSCVNHAIPLSE
jgi:hypothetical protein